MQDKTNSVFGIDLSHYNTVTDWNDIKGAGVKFGYFKATQGTGFNDPKCPEFVQGAKNVDIYRGLYHYAGLTDPVGEANHFKSILDQFPDLELIAVLDLEEFASGVDLVQWVRMFQTTLNRKMILYTGEWFINEHPELNQLSDIPIWISYYQQTSPPDLEGWKTWTMWQYSDKVAIPGIADLVDVDYGVSLEKILKVIPQPTLNDYVRGAIQSLTKKGYINSPQVWLDKLDKDEDLSDLAILLLDKVAK